MVSKAFLSLVIACWFSTLNCVQAQEPIIFKVKKPNSGIIISPESDTLMTNQDNVVCISSESKILISKVEVSGAKVNQRKNGCYSIRLNCGYYLDNGVFATCGTTTILSIYELLPDESISLVQTKEYKILNSVLLEVDEFK